MHDIRHHRDFARAFAMIALAVALLLPASQARAFSGQPDPAFGQEGRVRLGFHGGHDWANAAAPQADGRIVVVGTGRNGGWAAGPLLVARYNSDGSTDTSFGDGGAVWHFSDADTTYEPSAVTVQTDGKIVVVGNVVGGEILYSVYRMYVARFEANGSLDTTFGNGGFVHPYPANSRFWGGAMLIQADGRIVIAGGVGSSTRLAITRLNSNGTLDATFNNGYGYNAVTVMQYSGANAIGLLNGKYVVAGTAHDAANHSFILAAQFNDNGTLNTAFGGTGVVTTAVGTRAAGYSLAFETSIVQPTKIIVAGESDNQFALVRYLPDGTLDASFDGDGAKVIGVSAYDGGAVSVRVLFTAQVATRIVVAGFSQVSSGHWTKDFAVAKLTIGGALDTTFDGDGIVRTTMGTDGASPIAMLATGSRLTLIGTAGGSYTDADIALARYVVSSGALDTAFDGDGKRVDDLGLIASSARDVAVQVDGGIVVAGSLTRQGGPVRAVAARFLPNGTPDASFDGDGFLEIDNGTGECRANAVLVDPDGRIVIGGYGVPPGGTYSGCFFLSRRQPDGSPDPTFGNNGVVFATSLTGIEITALLRQSDGKLVAVGSLHDFNYYYFTAVRFETDGTIDTSFGPDGDGSCTISAHTDVFGGKPEPAAALQPDGSILIVGELGGSFTDRDVGLVRLTPDGLRDPSIGFNGVVRTAVGSSRDMARSVAVRPDGRIVVAGWTETGDITKAFVIRYLPNGLVDPSFGVGGQVILDLGDPASAGAAMAIELQPDGTIILAGHGAQAGDTDFAIARLTPHGAVDTSFGDSGQALVGFAGAGEDIAAALAFDAQGNVLLAGDSLGNFAVARVLNSADASAVIQAPSGRGGLFLSAPSPNPTTHGASLALELKADTRTSAAVYDVAGRVVRRLFGDRAFEAGRHTLGWDGRDDAGRQVAAGVYYLRLTAPGGEATRKVVVVR